LSKYKKDYIEAKETIKKIQGNMKEEEGSLSE
jgi:hypothetical protein